MFLSNMSQRGIMDNVVDDRVYRHNNNYIWWIKMNK